MILEHNDFALCYIYQRYSVPRPYQEYVTFNYESIQYELNIRLLPALVGHQ